MTDIDPHATGFIGAILIPATLIISFFAFFMDVFIYNVYILKTYASSEGPYFIYSAVFWNIVAVFLIYSTVLFLKDTQKRRVS